MSEVVRALVVLLLAGSVLLPAVADAAQGNNPAVVVEQFQNTLLDVMKKADELGYQGRYETLAPAVRQSHALPMIARVAVGRYWRDLSEQQQEQLVETFSELSIATYAHRFDAYSGETFRVLGQEQPEPDQAFVHTLLRRPAGDEIRFDYMLQRLDGRWWIVNIIVDGVSDLALKRAEYTSIIRRDGFAALIAKLEEKIVEYSGSQG